MIKYRQIEKLQSVNRPQTPSEGSLRNGSRSQATVDWQPEGQPRPTPTEESQGSGSRPWANQAQLPAAEVPRQEVIVTRPTTSEHPDKRSEVELNYHGKQ